MLNLLLALVLSQGPAADGPPSAADVLLRARARARAEHKRIFLAFGATWCGPCHLAERYIQSGPISEIWNRSFVVAKLSGFKRRASDVENKGTEAVLEAYVGSGAPLPSYVILDENGQKLTDFKLKVESPGLEPITIRLSVPPSRRQASDFLKILHATTPGMSRDDLTRLKTIFDQDIDLVEWSKTSRKE